MKPHQLVAASFCASAVFSAAAFGNVINFDPDGAAVGNGTDQVASFAFLPGNSIAINGLTSPGSFTQLYQARLGSLLNQSGQVIPVAGLNSTFEITAIVGYTAAGTITGNTISASLAPGAGPTSFIKLYYNSTVIASDLAGTNFNTGRLIYTGTLDYASSVFQIDPTVLPTVLDQFNTANWVGTQSLTGIGGINIKAVTQSLDSTFFKDGMGVSTMTANSSTALNYSEADPSHQFVNLNGSAYIPAIGPVNGVVSGNNSDILIQAHANAAFAPEPASLGLLGVGALGLLARRRRQA